MNEVYLIVISIVFKIIVALFVGYLFYQLIKNDIDIMIFIVYIFYSLMSSYIMFYG